MTNRLENKINELGYAMMREHEDTETTSIVVVVTENDGKGNVAVFKNGILEERAMAMVMIADEAAQKTNNYVTSVAMARAR